jgi:hypothetical protein
VTYISETLRRQVFGRAHHRCEYCHLRADDGYMPHEVDHIRAEKHGGRSDESNLCLACFDCNRHKGSDFASFDPLDDSIVPLFNPRQDQWTEHFRHVGNRIQPISPQGRVTVQLLKMNAPERLAERDIFIKAGTYP